MLNSFYGYQYDPYYAARVIGTYARLFHASPDAPPVDVYLNNSLVTQSLAYRNFTEYLPLQGGIYSVKVFPAGQTVNPVINTTIDIPTNSIFTIAAVGTLNNISLELIPEPEMPIPQGMLNIRFSHLSPNAPAVDVILPNGSVLFSNVSFGDTTNYISVMPGTYTFLIRLTGTNTNVLYVPNINLIANRFLTIYAIGLAGATPPLQVVIPMDGNTYLR